MTRGKINKTAIRLWCKKRGMRINADAIDKIELLVRLILIDAKESAQKEERTTIMYRDLEWIYHILGAKK